MTLLRNGGITINIPEAEVGVYLRNGFKKVAVVHPPKKTSKKKSSPPQPKREKVVEVLKRKQPR